MRIIEWNCQGGFRNKNKEILELKPDVLIIPECESEEKLKFGQLTPQPNDFIWYGGDKGKKGIGIFSYSNYKFKLLKEFNPEFRYIVPLEVTDGNNTFLLFAIWAMDNKRNPIARYIGQIWLAINYYQSVLKENCILIGDFNSNQIWDEIERVGNHTDVVDYLKRFNIESTYHNQFKEDHGKEILKTFFMHRNIAKPYHIDYAFASHDIIKNGYNFTIENSSKWLDKSDHVPIVLDIISIESNSKILHSYMDFIVRHLNQLSIITKSKFQQEISELETLADDLDLNLVDIGSISRLIKSIEALKQIDILSLELQKRDTNNK